MSNYCEDCGCRTSGGVCSNCQEELYILNEQYQEDPFPLSQEFVDKAKEQKELLESRKVKP
jgi:hypothetical protein